MRNTTIFSTPPILSALLVLCAVSIGCSSGAYCERNSKCKNQPATDRSDGGACAATVNQYGPNCRTQHEAFLNCALDHEVCTSDGKTDPSGTAGYAQSSCVDHKKKLDTCIATDGGS
jgi:hypothetical protein